LCAVAFGGLGALGATGCSSSKGATSGTGGHTGTPSSGAGGEKGGGSSSGSGSGAGGSSADAGCGPLEVVAFDGGPAPTQGADGTACTRDDGCKDGFCVVVEGTCAAAAMVEGAGKGGHAKNGSACVPAPAFPTTCDALALEWSAPVDVSKNAGSVAECDTSVTRSANGDVLVAWANNNKPNTQRNGLAVSKDGGKTFTLATAPSAPSMGEQNDDQLAVDADGLFYYVWEGFGAGFSGAQHVYASTSTDAETWTTPLQVDTPADSANGTIPLDFPNIAINPVDQTPYFTYQVTANANTIPLRLVVGAKGGASVGASVELDDGTRTAFRDLAIGTFDAAGSFYVAWLEATGSGGSTGQGLESGDTGNAIYFTRIDRASGGGLAPLGHDVQASATGASVAFGLPVVQVAPDGSTVFLLYEAGTSNAIDIYAVTSTDRGLTWSAPTKVNDDATCATHWHKAAALDAKGRLWVLCYDNRDGEGHVVYSVSDDGAKTFHPNRLVTPLAFPFETFQYSVGWLGDYFGVTVQGGSILAAWSDPHEGAQSHIYVAQALLP
jgi:hypothetical protein